MSQAVRIEQPGPARPRPGWARPEHPVYRLESEHRAVSPVLEGIQNGCLPLILATAGLTAGSIAALFLANLSFQDLIFIVPNTLTGVLVVFVLLQLFSGAAAAILVLAQTAPLISGEVELQSWGLLRTTTLSLREILMAKYAAALAHLRSPLIGLIILRAASTITGLLYAVYEFSRNTFYYDNSTALNWMRNGGWIMPVIAGVLVVVWYAAQPVMQFLLNGALGLLVSAYTRTRGRAIAFALAGRLAWWIGSALLNALLIYVLQYLLVQNWANPSTAPIEMLRDRPAPSPDQVAWVLGGVVAAYALVMLVTQLGAIAGMLRLATRRAGRIGG